MGARVEERGGAPTDLVLRVPQCMSRWQHNPHPSLEEFGLTTFVASGKHQHGNTATTRVENIASQGQC
jgi:hypothetical protein